MTDVSAQPDPQEPPSGEDFAAMLEESLVNRKGLERTVIKGTVMAIENDTVVIDVGLKSEGRVSLKEFSATGQEAEIKAGDIVDVYLERMENKKGEVVLSREKARREESWGHLDTAFKDKKHVEGVIFGRVKGGFTVDLGGAVAFLPGSQVDVRPMRDIGPLMGSKQTFQILKMDRRRGNIVVSRRAVLEESRAELRADLLANLKEGQVLEGVVKNITDYGAFVDLGGIDGLLHVTDMSWKRVRHPSEVLRIGETLKVQVVRFNSETQRISLGMKQLQADPWDGIEAKYPVKTKFRGRVTNTTDYGAFVELEAGIEGLVHISEMSWTRKNVPPGKIVSTSQEVEVMVLDVDPQRRRISLGLKQCQENPWVTFFEQYPQGTEIEGAVKNITEFGLFIGLDDEIDGMVHLSDLDWALSGEEAIKNYNKGDVVKAKVLDINVERERVSLGVKQLTEDPYEHAAAGIKKGNIVTCTITAVLDGGIEVSLGEGATGFIRRSDLSRERSEQRPDRFAVGEKVDARVTSIDRASRKISLSIRSHEIAEEKRAVEEYGSTDSGASLGDILGAAIHKANEERERSQPDAPESPEAPESGDATDAASPAKKTVKKATKKVEEKAEEKAAKKTAEPQDDEAEKEAPAKEDTGKDDS
jgi:small subunit ribosomal protein S1